MFVKIRSNLSKNWLLFIGYFIWVLYLISIAYTKGGRWDLFQQIAMIDRFFDLGYYSYSGLEDNFFNVSTPYFPGLQIIIFILKLIFNDSAYIVLLLLAQIIGLFFVSKISNLTYEIVKVPKSFTYSFLLLLLTINFQAWVGYLTEFKPDTLILFLSLWLFETYYKNDSFIKYFKILMIFIFIGLLKQQSIAIFAGFLILTFFEKIKLKSKVTFIIIQILSGLIVLLIIFMIPNAYYHTVNISSQHNLYSLIEIISLFYFTFINNFVFVWFTIYTFIFYLFSSNIIKSDINNKLYSYFLVFIPWLLIQLLSAIKIGGNLGNTEVGLIIFTPIIIYMLFLVTNSFENKIKKVFNISIFILSIVTLIPRTLNNFVEDYFIDNHSITYLKENFYSKKVFYDSNIYIEVRDAGLDLTSEFHTYLHYSLSERDLSIFYANFTNIYYDLIYLDRTLEEIKLIAFDLHSHINENYEILIDDDLPEKLFDKVFIPREG
jgi:hypothetical protein